MLVPVAAFAFVAGLGGIALVDPLQNGGVSITRGSGNTDTASSVNKFSLQAPLSIVTLSIISETRLMAPEVRHAEGQTEQGKRIVAAAS